MQPGFCPKHERFLGQHCPICDALTKEGHRLRTIAILTHSFSYAYETLDRSLSKDGFLFYYHIMRWAKNMIILPIIPNSDSYKLYGIEIQGIILVGSPTILLIEKSIERCRQ